MERVRDCGAVSGIVAEGFRVGVVMAADILRSALHLDG